MYILLSSLYIEETIFFVKIFDFQFLMDLHVFGCPEHDLAISEKYLFVYLFDRMRVTKIS